MAPLTNNDKKVRDAKRVIKGFRASEDDLRADASSRSTGVRNVYKGGYEALAKVEELLNRK